MSSTLSPSGLKIMSGYGESGWYARYNENMTLLNNTILKLRELQGVNDTGLANNQVLRYDLASLSWKPHTPPARFLKRTLTSTSTTTTVTTTSSSTTTSTAP